MDLRVDSTRAPHPGVPLPEVQGPDPVGQ